MRSSGGKHEAFALCNLPLVITLKCKLLSLNRLNPIGMCTNAWHTLLADLWLHSQQFMSMILELWVMEPLRLRTSHRESLPQERGTTHSSCLHAKPLDSLVPNLHFKCALHVLLKYQPECNFYEKKK